MVFSCNVLDGIIDFCDENGLWVEALDFSPITGPEGNIEFLAKIIRKKTDSVKITKETVETLVATAHRSLKE